MTTTASRQTEATRKAILDAAAGLFLDRKVDGFSIQEVADRAGLAHRTVYRHFPTRKELIHTTVQWLAPGMVEEQFSQASSVQDWLDALEAHLAITEANFDAFRGLIVAAMAADDWKESDEGLAERDAHRWEVFGRQFPHLSDTDARRTFAAIRHLTSSVSYVFLRLRSGLSPAEAAKTIRSGASQIVEQAALRNRAAGQKRSRKR
jgi:AcrR family transcriptional regulator